jgi:hypothetical protein
MVHLRAHERCILLPSRIEGALVIVGSGVAGNCFGVPQKKQPFHATW